MFYLIKSGCGSEPLDSVGNMSKSDILRGIITEKLSTAAREILAVVERTVADYEEETSGFKREIDRQRRQLELLQPRVKLERRDLDIHEVVVVTGDKKEQQHTHPPGVASAGSVSLLWYNDGSDEEEQLMSQLSASSRQKQEDRMHPDYEMPRRKSSTPWISDAQNHLHFRICILEDSQSGLKKSPVQDLKCPRDLQEGDFLSLLRSTFPQLAGDKPFNIFEHDRSNRLQRLDVQSLTPEEIYRTTKPTGVEKTVLYIKLKTGEEEEELHQLLANDEPLSHDTAVMKRDEAELHSSPVQHVDNIGVDVMANSSTPQLQVLLTKNAAESDSSDDQDGVMALAPELQMPRKLKKKRLKSSLERIRKSKIPCKVCGLWYRNHGSLIKHAWSHVDEPPAVCGICGERFESVEALKGHLTNYQKHHNSDNLTSLHTEDRPFKCNICSKTFTRMSILSTHRWVHVEERPYKCDICLKSFGLKAQLKTHCKEHASLEKYHCNICGKTLSHSRSMSRHKLTHTVERPYSCEICGKHFKYPSVLNSHKKIHTVRERSYLCHICCKTFMSNSVLSTHMKIHSSERPHICGVCRKGFVTKGSLKAHMRMHTGETPYSCSECGRFFKHKSHLNDHIRNHLGIKRFVCGVCGKACSRQGQLKSHMRTHNGEKPYQCTICKRAFSQSSTLKSHMKIHEAKEKGTYQPENKRDSVTL
ncbi:zinc finger protein 70-like [Archocentrus centrarchus]|uniref:zinc finger protein 70-like n=1 Tax=Archocentrus centrarchus TaxID=63155 RepID=UPI0011E9E485|nr:zinc finger protein 70-like [Archocentrus centrarchus]